MKGKDMKSHVMNDDILGLIFKYIDIKELFGLQTVCRQFLDTSQKALAAKTGLSIGYTRDDWLAIDMKDPLNIDRALGSIDLSDQRDGHALDSVLKNFREVRTLYVESIALDFNVFAMIMNRLPDIQCLNMSTDSIVWTPERTVADWVRLIAKIKRLVIRCSDTAIPEFTKQIVRQLPALQSLEIKTIVGFNGEVLVQCVPPAGIRSLKIYPNGCDAQTLNTLATICPQMREICIALIGNYFISDDSDWFEKFTTICERFPRLERLAIELRDISSKVFAENIAKLPELRHLVIQSPYNQSMRFDTTAIMPYIQPMVNLRSLSLIGIKCSPQMLSRLAEMLPNVRQISLNAIHWNSNSDLFADYNPHPLMHSCMQVLVRLPQLKHMTFGPEFGAIELKTLDVLLALDSLSLQSTDFCVKDLCQFMTTSVAHKKTLFRLEVVSKCRERVIRKLDEMNAKLPDNLVFAGVKSIYSE